MTESKFLKAHYEFKFEITEELEDGKVRVTTGITEDIPGIIHLLRKHGYLLDKGPLGCFSVKETGEQLSTIQEYQEVSRKEQSKNPPSISLQDWLSRNIFYSEAACEDISLKERLEKQPYSICVTIDGQKKYYVPSRHNCSVNYQKGEVTTEKLLGDLLICLKYGGKF